MENYLCIISKGEIDPLAFTLLGGTTKRGDSGKIGMFGSGLKYSISALIRNNVNFKVFSGERELKFELVDTDFRGKNFKVIYINGKETSLTTNMGGDDWDKPFAPLREIYSNALDEDDTAQLITGPCFGGNAGYTMFYIEMNESVTMFYNRRHEYFLKENMNKRFETEHGSVYGNSGGKHRLFRKGILSYSNQHKESIYWNDSHKFRINESRVVSNYYQCEKTVSDIWKSCEDEISIMSLVNHCRNANHGSFERELDWKRGSWVTEGAAWSDTWGRFVKGKKFAAIEHVMLLGEKVDRNTIVLKLDMIDSLKSQFDFMDVAGFSGDGGGKWVEVAPNPELVDKVSDAVATLRETDYHARMSPNILNEIKYVEFTDQQTLGCAVGQTVYLSVKLVLECVEMIAQIIIEENEHNKTGLSDESRGFQDHLFKLYYNQLIKKK